MIEPKEITVQTMAGESRTYVLSKFPAIAGREIVAKYPLSSMPKLGDYGVGEETMLKLMRYVGVPMDSGTPLMLTTAALVNNHVPDWETLAKLEVSMLEYNTSFFSLGGVSKALGGLEAKIPQLITKILMDLSAQSSAAARPR